MVLLTLAKPRLAWSTCLLPISLFALAPLAHGQGYSNQAMASAVSVHELQVPYKARNEYQKGLDHLNKQDAAGSVSHFAKAIEKDSNFYEAYYELGVAQVRLGQNDEAMTSFQSAIDRSGGSFALAEFAYGLLLCHKEKRWMPNVWCVADWSMTKIRLMVSSPWESCPCIFIDPTKRRRARKKSSRAIRRLRMPILSSQTLVEKKTTTPRRFRI